MVLRNRNLRVFLAVTVCAFLLGAGFAAAQHDCTDSSHHDSDHCSLCTLASSAAETSPSIQLPAQASTSTAPVVSIVVPPLLLLPTPSDPRAPPSLVF